VGAFTCLFAAVIACTQNDIKRVLAFSTLSQLGYMMFALGVSSMDSPLGYTASLFHLFTHAFFKALLFLGAGAVIHAVHTNEIWSMGGLVRRMPITHITFLTATLAIAGVPPLSGFFSKDLILAAAWENHHPFIFGVGLLVAGITAFYMFRIYFITFWGKARSEKSKIAHEAPLVMLVPLIVLAAFSVVSGFVPMGEFVRVGAGVSEHSGSKLIPVLATITGLIGIIIAWLFYGGESRLSQMVVKRLGSVYTIIHDKFYIDEIYLFVTQQIIFPYIGAPIAWFDRHVVDGTVNLTANLTRLGGVVLSRLQTGQAQTYGVWLVNGAIVVALFIWIFTK
jgi:NADH-quinone oxidoreductase subunit L